MSPQENNPLRVAVVGACASGKSTLVQELRSAGFDARHVAQEHSFVPAMWQRISHPDVLVYLDVDFENVQARRPDPQFSRHDLAEQERRLNHARANCDLYVDTNSIRPEEVREKVFEFLRGQKA